MVYNTDWKNMVIPGQAINHYPVSKYNKDRDNVENGDLLVITTYVTHTNIYKLHDYWTESNEIPTSHIRHQLIWHNHKEIIPKVWTKPQF